MTSKSFSLLATVTASTKRPPALDESGKRGAPATNLASLKCLPIDPVSPEVQELYGTGAGVRLLETSVQGGLDIIAGDRLVVGTKEYPVKATEDYTWPADATTYRRLILEELKGAAG